MVIAGHLLHVLVCNDALLNVSWMSGCGRQSLIQHYIAKGLSQDLSFWATLESYFFHNIHVYYKLLCIICTK